MEAVCITWSFHFKINFAPTSFVKYPVQSFCIRSFLIESCTEIFSLFSVSVTERGKEIKGEILYQVKLREKPGKTIP